MADSNLSVYFSYRNCPVESAAVTAPFADIAQGLHDNLFAKLFYSWQLTEQYIISFCTMHIAGRPMKDIYLQYSRITKYFKIIFIVFIK